MGCGGSKFELEGKSLPDRIRPILHRRFEEIRRRRQCNGLKESTPSKKELLCNDFHSCEEDDDDDGDHSASPRSLKSVKPVEIVVDVTIEEIKPIMVSDEDDDDDEEVYICPRSPSFRVYCVETLPTHKIDNNDRSKIIEIIKESSEGEESFASSNSTEDIQIKSTVRKEKKGSRFRRVIPRVPKAGHNAVKNLLRAKSCYNPAESTHGHTRLPQKPDA